MPFKSWLWNFATSMIKKFTALPNTTVDANAVTSAPKLPSDFDSSHPSTKALEKAASTGNATMFKSILSSASDPCNHLHGSILLCAISGGVPIWKIILSYDHSCMNAEIRHSGSILGLVVNGRHVELVKYLLDEGVDVEHAHWAYKPILPFAKRIGASKEIVDMLIAHGATMKTSPWEEWEDA
ncbi:hypothetical protein MMC18_001772 [Xylographa bjoerkii]|nr:hypothetical protein [Xylographa bjoerkii]